ncbi:MAG: HAMP domain-containing histidine kinase [Magnetococcales bacterium]|nr:HAMP domain-containing histidine kinase [Magnetococcales bacterium]
MTNPFSGQAFGATSRSNAERRQLATLLSSILLIFVGVYLLSTTAVVPYIGIFMAALGIAVSVGQFYIHSIVDKVLYATRRDFYRGTSFSQLLFGGFILFLSASDLIQQNLGYGMIWDKAPIVTNLFYFTAYLLGFWSFPAMVVVVLSFLYPLPPENAMGRGTSMIRVWELPNSLKRLKDEEHFPQLHGHSKALVWLLLWSCFAGSLSLGFDLFRHIMSSEISSTMGVRLNSVTYAAFTLSATLTFLTSILLFARRLQRLFREKEGVAGFAFFMSMMALFAFPPILQLIISTIDSLLQEKKFAIILFAFLVMLMGWFALNRLKRLLPAGFQQPPLMGLGRFIPVATEYSTLVVLTVSIVSMILIIGGLQVFGKNGELPPLYYFSFLFYVLGCNYMAAVDLRIAAESAAKLQEHVLDDKFVSSVAHELYNPLTPVQSFVVDEDLKEIIRRPIEDNTELDNIRKSLLELHQAAIDGVTQAISYTHELKNRGSFAKLNMERLDIASFCERFVDLYRQQTKMPYGELDLTCHPNARPFVMGDDRLLKSVLRIYLDNAVEATETGKLNEIKVIVDRENQKEAPVTLTIRDTGRGMNLQQRERFGHQQYSTKVGGTGVGTAIARRFVEEMGGSSPTVLSEEGVGTTVKMSFIAQ